ncbi:MAG: cysteine hydrolase [Simkaniaceae bacterium]|nr:cysteine hydrolase [Simkaniaceae bacterium]MCF7853029.1 cysteine hydrolase [Simkaniaceae bacterium]
MIYPIIIDKIPKESLLMIRSLLLLVNFINDYVHEQGKYNLCLKHIQSNDVINKVNEAILFSRRHSIPIVHVVTSFHSNYIDLPTHSPLFKQIKEHDALKLDTWGCQIHEDVFIDPSDTILHKHRISCFYGTELEQIIMTQQINTLLIGGISTPDEVEMAAREAHDRDLYSIILSDLCAAKEDARHLLALEMMSRYTKIKTLEKLIQRTS